MPECLVINPHQASYEELASTARILLDGGVVACPTETFYALVALVDNQTALERVMDLKGQTERQNKPFLIMVDQIPRVSCYAREVPPEARELMEHFWPGPMTLLLMAQSGLHHSLVGSSRTVGLRVEKLKIVRQLARMVDRGLTGTSANPSDLPPATTAEMVRQYFGDRLDLIIDGGPTSGGEPSTIIDFSLGQPKILREGCLPRNELARICPQLDPNPDPATSNLT